MKQIFINLPVKDVNISKDFYKKLGFTMKPLFSDNNQKCMVWSEHIYVMLISENKFQSYSKSKLKSEKTTIDAYFTLPVESIDKVNQIVDNAIEAGGKEPISMIDEGFMQIRKIEDLDGFIWDIIYLDIEKFKALKK